MNLLAKPAVVVAGWGILNGVLAVVLAGFGGTALEFPVYLIAAALVVLNAGAVWLVLRGRPGGPVWREPPAADSVVFFAIGIIVAALGWAFAWYLAPAAVIPFILAFLRERAARRQRHAA